MKLARVARLRFLAVRSAMLASAALAAIFVNLSGHYEQIIAAAASVLVLLMIALDWGTDEHGRWSAYKVAAERLESEKSLYLSRAGVYSGIPEQRAFALFVERVETMRAKEARTEAQSELRDLDAPKPSGWPSALAPQSASSVRPANYEGGIHVRLSIIPGASSIVGRLICQFSSSGVANDGLPDGIRAEANVRIQGDEIDPVEFSVKVLSVSGRRLTAFPRVARVHAPVSGVSEPFEFALVAEEVQANDQISVTSDKDALLVDISQAGRTVQIIEIAVPPTQGLTAPVRGGT